MTHEKDWEGEQLLHDLAQAQRDDEARDAALEERWLAHCAEALPAAAAEDLLRDAVGAGELEASDLERAATLFRPLGEDFRAALAHRLHNELNSELQSADPAEDPDPTRQERRTASPPAALPRAPSPTPRQPRPKTSRPTSSRRSRWQRRLLQAAGAVAACGLLAMLAVEGPWFDGTSAEPLPSYAVSSRGGVQSHRGGPEVTAGQDLPTLAPGIELEVFLRPKVTVHGPVFIHLYMERQGSLEPWPSSALPAAGGPTLEIAKTGAVQITFEAGRPLALPSGDLTLLVVVGRSPRPPAPDHVVALRNARKDPGTAASEQLIELPMRILDGS